MYKSKMKIWVFLLLISLLLSNFKGVTTIIINFFKAHSYNTYVDIEDTTLRNKFDRYKKSGAKLELVSNLEDSNVIIQTASEKTIDGYTKYPNQFTSPIVMYVPYEAYRSDNSGFSKDSASAGLSTYYYIQKDLKIILEAIENDKKYSDIGIIDKVFGKDKKVQIAIPNKNSNYYEEVRLLITLTLNNYSYDEIDDPSLIKRVDAIIKKSITYEDAATYIQKINNDGKKGEKVIVLAPEYIVTRGADIAGSSQTSYSYIICIPFKTICLNYDLYTKNVENNDITYASLFKSLTKKKFIENIGLRNKELDFDIRDATRFYYTINSIPLIQK